MGMFDKTTIYAQPKLGEHKVRLITQAEDRGNKSGYTAEDKAFAVYSKNNSKPTSFLLRWEITEGESKGSRINQYETMKGLTDENFGMFTKVATDLGMATISVPEMIAHLGKAGTTLVRHREYSAENDALYDKWSIQRTRNSVADDATLESIHAEALAQRVADEKAKALLSDALSEEDI